MRIIDYDREEFEYYKDNLKLIGSLSLLFSESDELWLDYRVPEYLYTKCFGGENLARSCVTIDAKIESVGIGIKTFTEGNRRTWQKIVEFNKARKSYADLEGLEKIKKIAELRNERIESTLSTYGLSEMIYHCVVRNKEGFFFYEEKMDKIDISNIKIISISDTSLIFTDGIHEYNFNISKSVLLKRFNTSEYFDSVSVEVAVNPLYVLSNGIKTVLPVVENEVAIIPLYSLKNGVKLVYPKSGLNQWNANGRSRNIDEVYIPFNKEIRNKYKGFFPDKDITFRVGLPNRKKIYMKVCQSDGKALMSNPNSDLGIWLLRDVLRLDENEVLTYEKLAEIGIENVIFRKIADNDYELDFRKIDDESEE